MDPAGVILIWGRMHRPRHLSRLALNTVGDISHRCPIQPPSILSALKAIGCTLQVRASILSCFGSLCAARGLVDAQLSAIHPPCASPHHPNDCRHVANETLRYNLSFRSGVSLTRPRRNAGATEGQLLATVYTEPALTNAFTSGLSRLLLLPCSLCALPRRAAACELLMLI